MQWTFFGLLLGGVMLTIGELTSATEPTLNEQLFCEPAFCCRDWCFIKAGSNALKHGKFPNASKISLIAPTMEELSQAFLSKLQVVKELNLEWGTIPTVYIKPTLTTFRAQNNNIRELLIDDEDNHQLKYIEVTFNKLRSVPANINRLKNLTLLYFNNNEIEEVNADVFNGMDNLEVLKLNRNRIIRLDTPVGLRLPALIELQLGENQLERLDISFWKLPSLKMIFLASNKLESINGFTEKFPNLNDTSLHENRWRCSWLQQVVHEFQKSNTIVGRDENCPDGNEGGICCVLSNLNRNSVESIDINMFT